MIWLGNTEEKLLMLMIFYDLSVSLMRSTVEMEQVYNDVTQGLGLRLWLDCCNNDSKSDVSTCSEGEDQLDSLLTQDNCVVHVDSNGQRPDLSDSFDYDMELIDGRTEIPSHWGDQNWIR